MADNVDLTPGTGFKAAADEVTFSGDTAQDQLVRPTHVTGSEGAKTVEAITQTVGSAVPAAGLQVLGTDGTNSRVLKTDAAGELQIDVLTSILPTGAATLAEQQAQTTSLQLIDDTIFVDDAAFTIGTSKVQMGGAQAVAHGANPDAADALDAVILLANRHRVPFVIGGHPNVITYGMSLTTAVTNAIIGPTISAGEKLVVTGITVLLDNASTVFPSVVIGFGTATTPAFATTPGTAQVLAGHPAVPAGGGFSRGDGSGIIGIGVDDAELRMTTVGTAGGAGIYVLMTGYTIPS